MAKQSLGKRILSAILALMIVIGACPTAAFATGTTAGAGNDHGIRLPFTKVEDVDADVLHDAAKVTQPEEEVPYVTTAEGNVWVSINVDTLAVTVLSDYSDVTFDGAGLGSDGMMYASVNGKYVQIDLLNGFAATTGGDTAYSMKIKDGTASSPAQEIVLKDQKNGENKTVTVGGYMYYGADDWDVPYMVKLFDYAVPTTKQHNVYQFEDVPVEAIAYLSCEQVDDYYFHEYYLALNKNGDLYKLTEKSKVYSGTYGWQRSAEMIADLNLSVYFGASMAMLNENLALISVNGDSGVTLYTFDVTTNTLTTLGTLEGVTDLVGLTMLQPAAKTQAVNQVTGSTMTVAAEAGESVDVEGEEVTIADGNATINLYKEGTNGKLVITFDPAQLTYEGMTSASVYYSMNDADAASGKLVLAYAAAQSISAEDILATLNFSLVGEYVDTVVNVATEERDDSVDVDENADIIVSNALSDDNTLSGLTVAEGQLSPIFAPTVTDYTVTVGHDVEELTVSAIASDENATVVIGDTTLNADGTTVVTVTVTAENGDVRVYTITVTREAAPEDPTEPSEPENPTEPSEPEDPTEPSVPEDTKPSVDPENPITGDSFMSTFTVLAMLSSLVMLAWLVMNRKRALEA